MIVHIKPEGFSQRIWALLLDAADREGTDRHGPMEDAHGEPLQDDADAALSWIAAAITAERGSPNDDWLLGWKRYEKARKLSPAQWARLHARNLAGENFDAMIDALPEPSTPILGATGPKVEREALTDADLHSVCLSRRHDYGLLEKMQQAALYFEAKEWARAFGIRIQTHAAKESNDG